MAGRRVLFLSGLALAALLLGYVACSIDLGKTRTIHQGGDDASGDDAADDSGDDVSDDAGDDAGDDTVNPPDMPSTHDPGWNCYICHETAFNGAPGEPHHHAYAAPTDCVGCHALGTTPNPPHGEAAMNVGQDCLSCHGGQHGKPWQDLNQCLVCHQVGGGGDDDKAAVR